MIGDLAREIAEDIDTSKLNIENPAEILNDLLVYFLQLLLLQNHFAHDVFFSIMENTTKSPF